MLHFYSVNSKGKVMNLFETIMFCTGIWCTFWTVMSLITPSRTERLRSTMWHKLGHLADRIGIQFKSDKDQ